MRKVKFSKQTELKVRNIKGYLERKVVISGTSAKVNCPKEFLGANAILIILENGIEKRDEASQRRKQTIKRISRNINKKN